MLLNALAKSGVGASQFASAIKVTGAGQSNIGSTLSSMVTVAVHVEVLPASSVTVSTTEFAPILSHVNVITSIVRLVNPQSSNEPPSTSSGLMCTYPVISSCKEISLQTGVGGVVSCIIKRTSHSVLFPNESETVTVTVKSLLINVPANTLCSILKLLSPVQLSVASVINAVKSGTVS